MFKGQGIEWAVFAFVLALVEMLSGVGVRSIPPIFSSHSLRADCVVVIDKR